MRAFGHRGWLFSVILVLALTPPVTSTAVAADAAGLNLSNGRQLSPAGRMVAAGDFPATGRLLPGGTYAVANAGEGPNVLSIWDPVTLNAIPVPHQDSAAAGSPDAQSGSLGVGPDGSHFFSSGGAGHRVMEFTTVPPVQVASVSMGAYVGGIAVDGAALFVTLPFDSTRLYGKGNQIARIPLSGGVIPASPVVTRATLGDMPTAIAVGTPRGGGEPDCESSRGGR